MSKVIFTTEKILQNKRKKLLLLYLIFMQMTKQLMIEQTLKVFNQLPEDKVEEISDFAVFILKKYEDSILLKNLQKVVSNSNTFNFLNDEEDLYSLSDVKKLYND